MFVEYESYPFFRGHRLAIGDAVTLVAPLIQEMGLCG